LLSVHLPWLPSMGPVPYARPHFAFFASANILAS
jgi:hypothetical protein